MGTEVLRPQDWLAERYHHVSPPAFNRRRNFPAKENLTALIVNRRPSNNSNRKTSPKPDKKKFNESKKVTHGGGAAEAARRRDDSRQVTLLRRGESLDSLTAKANGGRSPNSNLKSPNQRSAAADDLAIRHVRLSPPPRADVYAGSAFSLSPSPRSVPLPSFFNKKQDDSKISPLDDPATRDLRRLLRLD